MNLLDYSRGIERLDQASISGATFERGRELVDWLRSVDADLR